MPRCAAFPGGVPDAIAPGENGPRTLLTGDRGIRWEPRRERSGSPRLPISAPTAVNARATFARSGPVDYMVLIAYIQEWEFQEALAR